jgi:hypothetical protein
MKYLITYILLLIALSYGQIIEPKFPLIVNIVLLLLILLTPVFWEYSVLNKNYESDFKMQSQRKVLGLYELIYAIAWTLLLTFTNDSHKDVIFLILIFWTFPLEEIVLWFIYKKKKPFTVFIKENQLILNNRWTQKRNLTELTQIRYDRFSKNLKLDFKSKYEISIKTTEYNSDDIQKLLEILIEKSENNVFIPNNYEPKIKSNC